MVTRSQRQSGVVIVMLLPLGLVGCREKGPKRAYAVRDGRVRSVNPETGEVSMDYVEPKTNTPIILKGRVTQDTEILINGRSASLDDVRLGDWVKVTGYREGPKTDPQLVANRVEIQRKGWSKEDPTGRQPTSGAGKPRPSPARGNSGG